MILTEYAKRIALFEAEGYHPPTIVKMLKSEGIFISRQGVAKFYQEYTYNLFALAGPRVAKHVKETTRATYARAYTRPYQKTGTKKLKRNENTYGTVRSFHRLFNYRSITVQYPFTAQFFLMGAHFTDRTGNFFDAYRTQGSKRLKRDYKQ